MRTTGWSKSILRLKRKFSLKSKKNVFDVKKKTVDNFLKIYPHS